MLSRNSIVAGLVLIVTGVCAPESNAASFRTLAWTNPVTDVFYSPTGDVAKLEPLEAYTHARSPSYGLAEGVSIVRLFKKERQSDGTEQVVEVGMANLAQAGSDALVILFEDRHKPGRYLTEVLDDASGSFRGGAFRFVNYTPVPIGITLGSEKARIGPKESKTLDGKPRTIGRVENVLDVGVYVVSDQVSRQVFGNIWSHNPSVRNLVFVVQVPGLQNAYEVKRITDDPSQRLQAASQSTPSTTTR